MASIPKLIIEARDQLTNARNILADVEAKHKLDPHPTKGTQASYEDNVKTYSNIITEFIGVLKELGASEEEEVPAVEAVKEPAPEESPAPTAAAEPAYMANHPLRIAAQAAAAAAPASPAPHEFNVNDKIKAQWSGDRQFYTARIISVSGSRSDPTFMVKFEKYGDTETRKRHHLRPIGSEKKAAESKKRKADDMDSAPAAPQPTATTTNPGVISAAATFNPSYAKKATLDNKDGSGVVRSGKREKKIGSTRSLNKSMNTWQNFQKGKGKTLIKESQFRINDKPKPGAGSQPHTSTQRTRHVFDETEEDDRAGA
ncbi:hypothetical protein K402DRAFT_422523 [Aulographum hederae CBS 113979]|uniref:Tudor domain-containing protein n=1 Tax=Aulographum hederae CBS 113979 TaxID=1176131 RepID=A0A6G1GVT2_9PEZI|nr:hypothetical protein K402DRAFT_422523 [Aulographum hederae CBS 113979]